MNVPAVDVNQRELPPRQKLPPDQRVVTYEQLLGCCEDFWDTDEEFEEFLNSIKKIRKEKDQST